MSNANFPIPTGTPVSDEPKYSGIRFGMIWNRFFKAIGDDVLRANTITTTKQDPNLSYVINMSLVVVTWYSPTPLVAAKTIQLPYANALAFDTDIDATIHAPGTQTITLPSGTSYSRFWYVADLGKAQK